MFRWLFLKGVLTFSNTNVFVLLGGSASFQACSIQLKKTVAQTERAVKQFLNGAMHVLNNVISHVKTMLLCYGKYQSASRKSK